MAQFESSAAPESGYWQARLMHHTQERHIAWNEAQVPLRYKEGELFDRTRAGLLDEDGRIQFHYLGMLVAAQPDADLYYEHPLVARGIARYGDLPESARQCKGHTLCPQTGVWSASLQGDHSMAAVFNQWHRQTYVKEGQPFPDPQAQHLDIEPRTVTWQWWDQANEMRGGVLEYIQVDELAADVLLKQAEADNKDGQADGPEQSGPTAA